MYAGSSTILLTFRSFKDLLVIKAAAPVHYTLVKGRPGKYNQLPHWRHPDLDDQPGPAKPYTTQGYDAFVDPSIPMSDIYDGWGWWMIQAGLEWRRGRIEWTIQDVDDHELHQRFVSLPLGLVFQMNIDWYVNLLTI